jgi:tRNA/tmRNA/rRNA uracil-C5-methylase (TrmA/RlmC/RlmD family)
VEAARAAAAAAERHLTPYPWARAVAKPTEAALGDLVAAGEQADVVVLDPPRTGAGRAVVEAVAALSPRAVVYVACDPAALARDVGFAREHGLELVDLRVLDAFPMTHHMECLALLRPVR